MSRYCQAAQRHLAKSRVSPKTSIWIDAAAAMSRPNDFICCIASPGWLLMYPVKRGVLR